MQVSEYQSAVSERDDAVSLLKQSLSRCLAQLEQQATGTDTTAATVLQVDTLRQQLEQARHSMAQHQLQDASWRKHTQSKVGEGV